MRLDVADRSRREIQSPFDLWDAIAPDPAVLFRPLRFIFGLRSTWRLREGRARGEIGGCCRLYGNAFAFATQDLVLIGQPIKGNLCIVPRP
jgi:hypothetical protein